MTIFLPILLLTSFSQDGYLVEKQSSFILENKYIGISISKKDGTITTLRFKEANLLLKDTPISISVEPIDGHLKVVEIATEDQYPEFAKISLKKETPGSLLDLTLTIDSASLLIEVELFSKMKEAKEVTVNYEIKTGNYFSHIYYPTAEAPVEAPSVIGKKLIYRKNMFLPLFTTYNQSNDLGLSLLAPLETPKPNLLFSIGKRSTTVSYAHIRLTAHAVTKTALRIVPHEGHWRPGLDYLQYHYPHHFRSVTMKTQSGEGWYYQARLYDSKVRIRDVADRGVDWVQFHYYFPFYGLYVPDMHNWGLVADSDEISIDAWETGASRKKSSYTEINTLIDLWKKRDIQVYMYFQPFEAWHQYARKYFPEDIARKSDGSAHPAFRLCNLMNPRPESKWGQHTIRQAQKMLEKYPEIDGIFYDRMDYWNYDVAHDDGITMINGTPAYMLGFAQEMINESIFQIMHKKGKGIWGNGPTSIEVCKNLDGIMAETSISLLRKLQYLALERPLIYLAYDRTPHETEEKLKHSLICGAFPSLTYGEEECQKLDDAYKSILDLMYNREWVVSPHPIDIPGGYEGNVFRKPDSNYVAYIVNPEKSRLLPHPFDYEIPVTIRLPDAHEIDHIYVLSGDWKGVNAVEFEKTAESIHMKLPCQLVSSALYLTKSNKYDIVRLSKPVIVKGQNEDLIFRVLNFDSTSNRTFTLQLPWHKDSKTLTSETVTFHTRVPENVDGEVPIKVRCNGKEYMMSCWVLDPLSITPHENIYIKFPGGENVPFYITNNTENRVTINIAAAFTKGYGTIIVPDKFELQPRGSRTVNFFASAQDEAEIQVTVNAGKSQIIKTFPVQAGLTVSHDDLFSDDFSRGMTDWHVHKGEWHVTEGTAQGSGPAHFAYVEANWTNYEYEVRTRMLGSTDSAVDWLKTYIYFRLQDEKNFYRFGIHGDAGIIDLYKSVNGKWTKLGSSMFEPQRDVWYVLKIEAKGPRINGFINGQKAIATTDHTFASGGIGIGVLEDGMICEYKDIIVKRL